MNSDRQRFDVLYGEHGPRLDFHFCRDWDDDGGCYGTNLNHGVAWEKAREEIAKWHEQQAQYWRKLTFDEWCPEFPECKE